MEELCLFEFINTIDSLFHKKKEKYSFPKNRIIERLWLPALRTCPSGDALKFVFSHKKAHLSEGKVKGKRAKKNNQIASTVNRTRGPSKLISRSSRDGGNDGFYH